jgi:hypothetical protein
MASKRWVQRGAWTTGYGRLEGTSLQRACCHDREGIGGASMNADEQKRGQQNQGGQQGGHEPRRRARRSGWPRRPAGWSGRTTPRRPGWPAGSTLTYSARQTPPVAAGGSFLCIVKRAEWALPELRGARLVECPSRHRGCHKYELTPCTGITLSRLPPPLAAYWPSSDCARSLAQFVWSGGSVRDRVNQREPHPIRLSPEQAFPTPSNRGKGIAGGYEREES